MNNQNYNNISVYGGGSWGTALACQVARSLPGCKVPILLKDKKIIEEISTNHTNNKYLKNILLPSNIVPTDSMLDIIHSEIILLVVPSVAFRNAIINLKNAKLSPDIILLVGTKGISNNPVQLLSEMVKSYLPNPIAFLSGPNFAKEVAEDLLTAVTIAAEDLNLANKISQTIESKNFIISTTQDIVTIQVAGALKNIIAIYSGMYEALGYKENAKASLITSGIQEIMKLSKALGGKIDSLLQPAVLGDLVLTCYSKTSRNTKFGFELALQKDVQTFLREYPTLIEGKESIPMILELMRKKNIDLPIVSAVARALEL